MTSNNSRIHDDVIKWKHFPRYWSFVRGIHRSPVNSPHKGQWHGALIFSVIYAWTNAWNKHSRHWWSEMPLHPLWRQCNGELFVQQLMANMLYKVKQCYWYGLISHCFCLYHCGCDQSMITIDYDYTSFVCCWNYDCYSFDYGSDNVIITGIIHIIITIKHDYHNRDKHHYCVLTLNCIFINVQLGMIPPFLRMLVLWELSACAYTMHTVLPYLSHEGDMTWKRFPH